MKNQKPNSRSRADTPNKSKHRIPDWKKSQNPPEIIVLPDNILPDNKPNPKPSKPIETPSQDKPSNEKPYDKK